MHKEADQGSPDYYSTTLWPPGGDKPPGTQRDFLEWGQKVMPSRKTAQKPNKKQREVKESSQTEMQQRERKGDNP